MLKNPKQEAIKEEQKIQQNIYDYIDSFKSFVFYAGAGAGKTYALKEGLRYILKNKQKKLKRNSQKIICITYTNIAVDEIKKRIGNTDLVLVSTIHKRMWDIIKVHQKELILIHREKLEIKSKEIKQEIDENRFYSKYQDKKSLEKNILIKRNKIEGLQTLRAEEYKIKIKSILNVEFSNARDFKKLVNNIIKKEEYNKAIKKIDNGKVAKIEYDMLYNSDRLEKMKFSHDTLLEYSYKMIQQYSNLQKILVNKYPYIFIDEFQDTNKYVIDSLKLLIDYAKENNKNFLVGYFGDTYQKIYTNGIGKKIIDEIYLEKINKKFNRRSVNKIINLINKVRDDDLKQETIFDDADGGIIEFQFGNGDFSSIQDYINEIYENNNFGIDNKLHVLLLTNKLIAKFGNFEEFYNSLSNFIYYGDLTSQIMSKDLDKLHEVVRYIFELIKLYHNITNKNILSSIIETNEVKDISLKEYKQDITKINQNLDKVTNLNLIDLFNALNDNDNNHLLKALHKKYVKYHDLNKLKAFFIKSLDIEEKKYEELDNFLNLDIEIFMNWYKYIISDNEEIDNKILYHTYHGTKGKEYDNVLIIMESHFWKKRNIIKNFFINKTNSDEAIINLLYVSFSRARKNLFIYYIIDKDLRDEEKELIEKFIKNSK